MLTNKENVLKLYAAFDRGEFELVRSMMSTDFIAHLVGMPAPLDREAFIQFGSEFRTAFPDGYHQFDEVIVEDNRVVTIGKFRGTHLGKFQGLPATGKSVEIEVTHIDKLIDDRIVYHWGQGNQAGMMQQLGIVFVPGLSLIAAAIRHQIRG
ncbi:ester cyclase [Chamaesiphon polymorphus]|uniref:Ester cyclase n=1 Tax=Chamaesiphon polymorphus CCALA 037 TaxID=2107692 RepID=A0A2T1GNS5_9CYAN|nr:ester cyclase [Chamaesiphon polymorphus]PSB59501.1 ester cyclase [Chamaesiphon polymorphus CCALA 037]